MPNLFAFKNHHLHHYFQKLTKSIFFQTHEYTSQTRGIRPCFIHFQKKKEKKKDHHHHLFIKK